MRNSTYSMVLRLHLFSTLIIWILGILLLLTFSYWIRLLHAQPTRLTLNHWYDSTGKYLPNYSANMTNSYVNGYVRDSLVIIFGILIVVTIVTLLSVPFDFNFKDINNIHIYEIAILILLIIAAFMVVIAKSRLFSVIMLGVVGYSGICVICIFQSTRPCLNTVRSRIDFYSVILIMFLSFT